MLKHLSGNSGWRYGAPPKKEKTSASPNVAAGAPKAPAPEAQSGNEVTEPTEGEEASGLAAPEEGIPAEKENLNREDEADENL